MSEHKHTDACLAYAAKTGKAYCIASCADSYRTEMTERDEAIRLRAELAREQANVEVLTEAIASYCRERNCWQERAMQAETRLDYAKADLCEYCNWEFDLPDTTPAHLASNELPECPRCHSRLVRAERERDEALAELRLARTEVNYHRHDAEYQQRRAETARALAAWLAAAADNARETIAFLRSCVLSGEDLNSDDIKHIDAVLADIRTAEARQELAAQSTAKRGPQ